MADLSWHQAEAGHHVELIFSAGGGVPLHERIRLRQFKSPTLDNISSSLSSIVFLSNVIFRLREPAPLDLIHLHGDWPEAFLGSWFGSIINNNQFIRKGCIPSNAFYKSFSII